MSESLPVLLDSFEAIEYQCSNRISWTVSWERKPLKYVLERSFDLKSWEELCRIPQKENNTSIVNYSYMDERASELNNKVYYRLASGCKKEHVLGVRVVENYDSNGLVFQMFPNPTNGKSQVVSKFSVKAQLIDSSGKFIRDIQLSEGVNEVDFTFLVPGFYTIMGDIGSCGRGYSFRFIKY